MAHEGCDCSPESEKLVTIKMNARIVALEEAIDNFITL